MPEVSEFAEELRPYVADPPVRRMIALMAEPAANDLHSEARSRAETMVGARLVAALGQPDVLRAVVRDACAELEHLRRAYVP